MKHLFISFLVTGIVQATNMVGGIIAARYLLPEGRGLVAAAMLWPGLMAAIGYLSIDQGLTYYSATRRGEAASLLTTTVVLAALLSAVTAGIGYFLVPVIVGAKNTELVDNTRLFLWVIPLTAFGLTIMGALNGNLRISSWNVQRLISPCVYVAAVLTLVLIGATTVRNFILSMLLANVAFSLLGIKTCWSINLGRFRLGDAGRILLFSLPLHVGALIGLAAQRIDQALISLYLPLESLGFYVVATNIAGTINFAGNTLAVLAFPKIASHAELRDKGVTLRRYFQLTVGLTTVLAVALLLVSRWLVIAFYGPAFETAATLVQILLLGGVAAALSGTLQSAVRAYGRTALLVKISVVSLVSTAVALAVLVPGFGIIGAAWAFVAAQWAICAFVMYSLPAFTEMPLRELFRVAPEDVAKVAIAIRRLYARAVRAAQ
jgi:O-antigen/teichoic acid export membrane protein